MVSPGADGTAGTDEGGNQRVKSVARAFKIVDHLHGEGPATLSEIAAVFDLPMSTAHVYASTLLETGYVTEADGKYRCSLRFLEVGGRLRSAFPLYRIAKSEADDLRAATDEYAILGIEENREMVIIYKSESPESIDDRATVGSRTHLHSTAIGKSILSTWTEREVDELIRERGLPAKTDNTITSRDVLLNDLEEIRERGYAVNNAENYRGLSAVATPIVSSGGETLGAIAVSGPSRRLDEERIDAEIVPKLFIKRNIIELKL